MEDNSSLQPMTASAPPPAASTTVSDLQAAREIIRVHGIKGNPCVYNAVYNAIDGRFVSVEEVEGPLNLLFDALPQPKLHTNRDIAVWRWHDHDDTTHADVLSLFDRAIAAAESSS